ncbi:Regulatory protein BlaR1 [Gimesia maris]|uniref:M56 family metallopeptidase n=1 Tax=Gimesia maris TaxID=122 RepID=UPI00118A8A47|nr:M56 family metallopeptidase [Gimesia maris]QDU12270.1 Regulatory protein BlaR1 [Gimesia maris]
MNAFDFWKPGDLLLLGSVNVLLQVTFVTALFLVLAAFLRRNPTVRYGLLCTALILIMLSPVITLAMQSFGKSLLTFSLETEDAASRPSSEVRYVPVEVDALPLMSSAGNRERQHFARSALPDPTEPGMLKRKLHSGSVLELSRGPKQYTLVASEVPTTETGAVQTFRLTLQIFLFVWIAGTVIALIRQLTGWYQLTIILRTAKANRHSSLAESFAEAGRLFPQKRLPELVLSVHVSGPVSAGLFRPRVIFPEQLASQIAPEALRDIFIHEIAHSVRRDQVILLIQNLVSALFWLHPLVKILNRQLAQAREEVCDNYVLEETDAKSYSQNLLTFASLIQNERLLPGAIGLFTSRWKLEHRIAGLLDRKRSRLTRLTRKKLLCLLALSFCMTVGIAAGTFTSAVAQTEDSKKAEPVEKGITVRGTITTHEGKPAAGAHVEVIGLKPVDETKPDRKMLAEGVADQSGHYELTLTMDEPKSYSQMRLHVRTEHSGLFSRAKKWQGDLMTVDLKLPVPLNGIIQFVDAEGRSAKNLSLETQLLNFKISATPSAAIQPLQTADKPVKRPQKIMNVGPDSMLHFSPCKTDDQGKLLLNMFDLRRGVTLKITGSEQFAPQWVIINSGQPEERSKHDGTYRDIIRNIKPGETLTIPLAPAKWFSGRVLLGDTGKPATNTRIKIWASQQEKHGSMVSIEGKTDAAGNFRLNPRPGVRFGIIAYPPQGTPYLTREVKDLRWTPETSKKIEIKLDKVVLAEGFVRDAKTGQPLEGAAVQYYPESGNNKRDREDIIAGWQSIQKTDKAGKFQIPVLPGPGTLLVHAADRKYILQEQGTRELHERKPGGARIYAHAFQRIHPVTGKALEPLQIDLQPGATVAGTLIDPSGKPVPHALVLSRLKVSSTSPDWWRGDSDKAKNGTFELKGLREGEEYPVYFLDPEHRLGAAALISTKNLAPRIVLKPCGAATARYVDQKGKPIADEMLGGLRLVVTPGKPQYDLQAVRRGEKLADEAFVANIDRLNYQSPTTSTTNAQGKLFFPALIPGAPYRHVEIVDGHPEITHEFILQPGEQKDLGEIEIQLNE